MSGGIWWEKIGRRESATPDPASMSVRAGRRNPPIAFVDDDEREWTPVGELDPRTGQWTTPPPAPGWERRATGWRPWAEFLRDR